jgi:hypothetical protein
MQHQRPIQPAEPGEFAQCGQPGEADAKYHHTDSNPKQQRQGIAEQSWHLGIPQVRPDLGIDTAPAEQQNAQRQQDQRRDGKSDGIPAALDGMGHSSLDSKKDNAPDQAGAPSITAAANVAAGVPHVTAASATG